jgi:acetylornithine deacetylase
MDLQDVVALTCALVDIDSTTGRECDLVDWLAARLRERGYDVVEQPVDGGRRNLFARLGTPDVVFSSHLDCVPPFFSSRREGGTLLGRGACDAKGAVAAQVAAAERLRQEG